MKKFEGCCYTCALQMTEACPHKMSLCAKGNASFCQIGMMTWKECYINEKIPDCHSRPCKEFSPREEIEVDEFEIRKFLFTSGHPLAPNEPVIEKIRNLVCIINGQAEILQTIAGMIPGNLELLGRIGRTGLLETLRSIQAFTAVYKK